MADKKITKTDSTLAEIKDFSWCGAFELFVDNPSKDRNIIIKSQIDYDKGLNKISRYLIVEIKLSNKNIKKIKKVKLNWENYKEFYQKLKAVKLLNLVPNIDYALIGVRLNMIIERGNSKIILKWIYGTQSKWQSLDNFVLYVLEICNEKRMLVRGKTKNWSYPAYL